MPADPPRKSSRQKVRAPRAQGLKPLRIRVPDTRSPAFAAEAHRQSLAVAASPHAGEDQAFIDAVSGQVGALGAARSGPSRGAATTPASRARP